MGCRLPLKYSTNLGALDRWKNNAALAVRKRVFNLFMRELAPAADARVADFGVSGHDEHPAHYFFETFYPHTAKLTAIGREAEGARWMAKRFDGLTFLEADLRSIPLEDNYFDAGICNAVVEHAGCYEQQLALIHEVCRVSRNVMFTTPNKGFPVELHTFLPFVHWLPDPAFRRTLRWLGLKYFEDPQNLNPLDARDFLSLFPRERKNRLLMSGFGPIGINLVCISTARPTDVNHAP